MSAGAPDPAWQAEVAAALLSQGAALDPSSRLATALAMAAALVLARLDGPGLAAVLCAAGAALGLGQCFLALRVGFDARLFARLAERRLTHNGAGLDLDELDAALIAAGLLPHAKAGRDLAPRLAGARRLLALQGAALCGQVGLLLAAAVAVAR